MQGYSHDYSKLPGVVIDNRYTSRNPYLSIGSLMESIPEHGGSARVFYITEDEVSMREDETGHFTATSGISIYTSDLFPSELQGTAFVEEPAWNVVDVDLLKPKGATFEAKRAYEGREFLASTDSWFRPVSNKVGPDGALYIADMYRKLIEHPAWIARVNEESYHTYGGVLQLSDFHEGEGLGRIYRVVPENHQDPPTTSINLRNADSQRLVEQLENLNMWWRTTAQRLLVERQDYSVIQALQELLKTSLLTEARSTMLSGCWKGLEANLSIQQMADLLDYIKNLE